MKNKILVNPSILFGLIALILFACNEPLLDADKPGNLVPETVVEDPLLPRIEINGTILHAETFGDITNPIIVFLHGGPGSDYRAFISQKGSENASRYPDKRTITNGGLSQLQDEYYCVFYDQRGSGLSPRFNKGELSLELFIDDLDAIIDYYLHKKDVETGINETSVYLLGWSFGGILSTGYINKHPEKVKDAAFYEPGPFSVEVYDYFVKNSTSVFAQMGKDWLEEYLLSKDYFTADDHARADYQQLLGAFRSKPQFHEDSNCPMWRHGGLIEDDGVDDNDKFEITNNLAAFSGRILFIGGEYTMNEYPEYIQLQMQYYSQTEYVEIPEVGHTGPWEKPDEIAGIIRNFLQSN